jgi:cytochrome c
VPLPRNKPIGWLLAPLALVVLAGGGAFAEYRYEQHDLREKAQALTRGNVDRGERAFMRYGCGGCHSVQGVPQAQGKVGPPLDGVGGRAIIGGRLENKPDNLMRWIVDPQGVAPGTAMPNLGVKPGDARDISAFLYMQT